MIYKVVKLIENSSLKDYVEAISYKDGPDAIEVELYAPNIEEMSYHYTITIFEDGYYSIEEGCYFLDEHKSIEKGYISASGISLMLDVVELCESWKNMNKGD